MANELSAIFTNIADAIRFKNGTSAKIPTIELATEIRKIGDQPPQSDFPTMADYMSNKITEVRAIDLDGVAKIPQYAFAFNYALTKVTLPVSVTEIGNDCFRFCRNLTDFNFGRVQLIGSGSFTGTNIQVFDIPDSFTSLVSGFTYSYDVKKLILHTTKTHSQKIDVYGGFFGSGVSTTAAIDVYIEGDGLPTSTRGQMFKAPQIKNVYFSSQAVLDAAKAEPHWNTEAAKFKLKPQA